MPAGSLKDLPDVRETPESQIMGDQQHMPETPIVEGQTVDRLPTAHDQFSLSERSREKYGVRDDEDIAWGLETSTGPWSNHVAYDRINDILDENPGARVVINPDTKQPVRRRDLVLIAKPKALQEAIDERNNADAERFMREVVQGDYPELPKTPHTDDEMEAARDANSRALRELGYIGDGSPTHGVPLAQALAYKTADEIAKEAAFYRSGGRETRDNAQANHVDMLVEKGKTVDRGSKAFGGLTGPMDKWQRGKQPAGA